MLTTRPPVLPSGSNRLSVLALRSCSATDLYIYCIYIYAYLDWKDHFGHRLAISILVFLLSFYSQVLCLVVFFLIVLLSILITCSSHFSFLIFISMTISTSFYKISNSEFVGILQTHLSKTGPKIFFFNTFLFHVFKSLIACSGKIRIHHCQ